MAQIVNTKILYPGPGASGLKTSLKRRNFPNSRGRKHPQGKTMRADFT